MSLANKTCWVVGGVGVVGRGITRGLLQAGANVIVNSREQSRLDRLADDLNHPERLELVKGSLLPEFAEKTVEKVLSTNNLPLHHVVAHGAVRYWTRSKAGCDETYFLDNRRLFDMSHEEFASVSNHLSKLHFSAASALLPRLDGLGGMDNGSVKTSYTFVTGDGGGHTSGQRTSVGELNSYHIWGLSAAIRNEMKHSNVSCREVRVGLPINRSSEERELEPRERPLSEDIGDLCAGLAASTGGEKEDEGLFEVDCQATLEKYLIEFNAAKDKHIDLPNIWEFSGSL